MEQSINDIATRVVDLYNSTPTTKRILVCVAGVPGSGKSTLAYPLVDKINLLLGMPVSHRAEINIDEMIASNNEATEAEEWSRKIAVCTGLDGFHFSRNYLDGFPDPKEAHRTRGAPPTFDSASYSFFIHSLTLPSLHPIPFPTFSHSLKDPLPSPHLILPSHRIIIVEGLYTLLDTPEWIESTRMMDLKIYVQCAREVARSRLIRRHLLDGVESSEVAARERVDGSDMINGEFIRNHLVTPDVIVESIDDPVFGTSF